MKRAGIKIKYEVLLKDPNGKIITKRKGVSKSLLANFMRWFRGVHTIIDNYGSSYTMTDITGTSRTLPYTGMQYQKNFGAFGSPDNDQNRGIVVGSSDTPVNPNDYKLASQIPHGTGSGQLDYGAGTLTDISISDNTISFNHSRTFTNLSGATITVKEIGGYFVMNDTGNVLRTFCYLRDVLTTPIDVPDNYTLTVIYTFQVSA
jgi:hypothetical protein